MRKRSVLFICPRFFDHHIAIKRELEDLNQEVCFIEDRLPGTLHNIFKFLYRINVKFANNLYERIYRLKYLNLKNGGAIDTVFIIRGEKINGDIMKILKKKCVNARFIMYQWDSIKNHNYTPLLGYFDKVFSFDYNDCKKIEKLHYLPLYYTQEYDISRQQAIETGSEINLIFVGQYLEDRYKTLMYIKRALVKEGIKCNFLVYVKPIAYLKFLLKGKIHVINNLTTKKLNRLQIIDMYTHSSSVLDVPSEGQSGLTMRTFEVLGMNKKLITTNKLIKEHDFYHNSNIYILKQNEIDIRELIGFLKNKEISDMRMINNYSLSNWLNKILK